MKPGARFFAFSLVAALASAGAHSGETGYDRDYDYPGHGDDWYGRGERDMDRDYAPTPLELTISGDDFCMGYEPEFDELGFGPILERTQEAHFEFDFRFLFVDSDLFCGDGVPSCDDGDPCTEDHWNGSSCQHVAPPVPAEVQDVTLELDPLGVATLVWDPLPWADVYDVYRASSPDLGGLMCLVASAPVPMADDDGQLPGSGEALFMLVTGRNCSGESTLGEGRTNDAPCQ